MPCGGTPYGAPYGAAYLPVNIPRSFLNCVEHGAGLAKVYVRTQVSYPLDKLRYGAKDDGKELIAGARDGQFDTKLGAWQSRSYRLHNLFKAGHRRIRRSGGLRVFAPCANSARPVVCAVTSDVECSLRRTGNYFSCLKRPLPGHGAGVLIKGLGKLVKLLGC